MKLRRTLALLGPLTAAAALLLPWYYDSVWDGTRETLVPVRGWDLLTGANWLVLVIGLAVAIPVLRGGPAIARAASVTGGTALAVLALRCLFVPWANISIAVGGRAVGPWIVLAAGVATIVAGHALHRSEGDVDTIRRLLAVLGPLAAVCALFLPWFAYYDLKPAPVAGAQMGPWVATGWEEFTTLDGVLIGIALAAFVAVIGARRDLARGASVLCGLALVVVAGLSFTARSPYDFVGTLVLSGPFVTIAAGVATAVAGFFLYAPRRSASSLITAS
jgi:hypothetical protein